MKSFVNFIRENVCFSPSKVHGTGAFSTKDVPKGTEIGLFLQKVDDDPHRTYVRSDLCRLLNHSSSPNVDIVMKDDDAYVISNKPIKRGEEIFVNYKDVMGTVKPEEIKKNQFVRLYPNITKDKLEDSDGDFQSDLKLLGHK